MKQEVPTRWNSTFLMISSLWDLKVSDEVWILRRVDLDLMKHEWITFTGINAIF